MTWTTVSNKSSIYFARQAQLVMDLLVSDRPCRHRGHASMHIVVAATLCFDKTVTETVIQENLNPIEQAGGVRTWPGPSSGERRHATGPNPQMDG